ncbi:MAG: hypothetical protein J0H35_14185, partial [Rhodospirillales bacterium]|nr:hypothetical protein [Rhodospirillales bacterium]
LWDARTGTRELTLPAQPNLPPPTPQHDTTDLLAAVWRGTAAPPTALATIEATIALGLLATGRATDPASDQQDAAAIWAAR